MPSSTPPARRLPGGTGDSAFATKWRMAARAGCYEAWEKIGLSEDAAQRVANI